MSSFARFAAPVIRRSLSTSASRARKIEDLSPEIRIKFDALKKKQEFFQREDGNPVYMKTPGDRVLFASIVCIAIGTTLLNFKFAYDKISGKY